MEIKHPATRLCKQCNEPINLAKGRIDRVFCSGKCKSTFHNIEKFQEKQEIQKIDNALKKNRKILKKMFERKDNYSIKKQKLVLEGFIFDYHTHIMISKMKGNQFIFCYDYGYRETSPDVYRVIQAFKDSDED